MTKYIKILNSDKQANYIKMVFDYNLGGMNYFTGRPKKRGYYLTAFPVFRDGICESFTAFSGVSECVHECGRKSAKAENIAREKIPAYEKMMIDYIVNKYGYILEV